MNIHMVITTVVAIASFVLGRRFERMKIKNTNPHPVYIAGCDEVKNDCGPVEIGQLYEHKSYNNDPFERLKHPVRVIDIKEGYVRYKYVYGSIVSSMKESLFRENYVEI